MKQTENRMNRNWLACGVMIVSMVLASPAWAKPAAPKADVAKTDSDKAKAKAEKAYAALLDTVRTSMVIVKYHFKKDLSDPAAAERVSDLYSEYIDQKRPMETTGVVLKAGVILVGEMSVEDRFIDKIEVLDAAGKPCLATRSKLLTGTPGVLLTLKPNDAKRFKPLAFVPFTPTGPLIRLMAGSLVQADDRWEVSIGEGFQGVSPFDPKAEKNIFFGYTSQYGYMNSPSLTVLADTKGRPVGCKMGFRFDLLQKVCQWKGETLQNDAGIDWAVLQADKKALRAKRTPSLQKVILTFRAGASDSDNYYSSSGEAAGTEKEVFGLVVAPETILVPMNLDRKLAAKITGVTVKFSETDRREAKFLGAFKPFGAFLVQLPKTSKKGKAAIKLPVVPLAKSFPAVMRSFWTGSIREKFGKTYLDLQRNRIKGKTRGYEGKYYWRPIHDMEDGQLVLTRDGALAGVYLKQRKKHEEEENGDDDNWRWRSRQNGMNRIVTVDELRPLLAKPAKFFDPKIKVAQKRTQAERKAWLGVEFQGISEDLAKIWDVETPTKDGSVGLIVTALYPDSPAKKLGFRLGDILLKVKSPGRDYPTELGKNGGDNDRYSSGGLFGRRRRRRLDASAEGIFNGRENELTKLLDAVGVGKTVKITYYRRGEKKTPGALATLDYKIEMSPADQTSAPKWKNRKVGLTVKDLTYEIRNAMQLSKNAPGVIIVDIESGSAAQIARVGPMEILTRLNETPLTSAKQLRDLIAAAKKAGQEKVRLTVLRLDKTRFADLTITSYDPKDDEGIEETKK